MKYLNLLRSSWGRFTAGLFAMIALAWMTGGKITWRIEWEPTLTFLTLASVWLTSCLPLDAEKATARLPGGERPAPVRVTGHDRALYRRFDEAFPPRLRRFLREHDMGAAFRDEELEPLREVAANWRGAEFEFDHPDLAPEFTALLVAARQFDQLVAQETGDIREGWLKMIWHPGADLENSRRMAALNQVSDEVIDAIDAFVRRARPMLGD